MSPIRTMITPVSAARNTRVREPRVEPLDRRERERLLALRATPHHGEPDEVRSFVPTATIAASTCTSFKGGSFPTGGAHPATTAYPRVRDAPFAPGRLEPHVPGVLRDARHGEGARRTTDQRGARLPRHGDATGREPPTRRGGPRVRPRLAAGRPDRHLPRLQGDATRGTGRDHDAVPAPPPGARPHRSPPGRIGRVGGRGRDRRVLRRGGRGRPDRDRLGRPRPDPARAGPGREAPVHGPWRLELAEYDEAGVLGEVRDPGVALRGVRDPARDPSDNLLGVRGVGEKTARALVATYDSLDDLLADAAQPQARPGR